MVLFIFRTGLPKSDAHKRRGERVLPQRRNNHECGFGTRSFFIMSRFPMKGHVVRRYLHITSARLAAAQGAILPDVVLKPRVEWSAPLLRDRSSPPKAAAAGTLGLLEKRLDTILPVTFPKVYVTLLPVTYRGVYNDLSTVLKLLQEFDAEVQKTMATDALLSRYEDILSRLATSSPTLSAGMGWCTDRTWGMNPNEGYVSEDQARMWIGSELSRLRVEVQKVRAEVGRTGLRKTLQAVRL
ncbi:hypothetical protein HDU85_006271 [Gaertneriomyces sp. JEL0708]|nr:hypothetical protein HDU85_006271 [Gaertneriomyces sp. JEL0708]